MEKTKKKNHSSKVKKGSKKTKIIHHKKQNNSLKYFGWLIILLIIVGAVFYGVKLVGNGGEPANIEDDTVVVTVDGSPIMLSQVDETWNSIPVETKVSFTRDMLIDELIEEKLLVNKAAELGIEATDEEVEAYIMSELTTMGMSYEDFEEAIASQNMKIDTVKEIYQKQLTVAKLFEEEIDDNLNVSEEEIEKFYEENEDQFFQDEQVTVRHILVNLNNETLDEERVALIMEKINQGADFCDLVQNYSSDLASTENCGEYSFGRGYMAEEFEDASFEMENDEIQDVKTDFGIHIIKKISSEEAKNLTLDDSLDMGTGEKTEVKEIVRNMLIQQRAAGLYEEYVSNLKENAEIKYTTAVAEQTSEEPVVEVNLNDTNLDEVVIN